MIFIVGTALVVVFSTNCTHICYSSECKLIIYKHIFFKAPFLYKNMHQSTLDIPIHRWHIYIGHILSGLSGNNMPYSYRLYSIHVWDMVRLASYAL